MKYDFDKIISRENTDCVKYDYRKGYFGTKDVLPMWVADMDFETPDFITNALRNRTEHPIFGYSIKPDAYYETQVSWMRKRHQWEIRKEWIVFCPGIVPALNLCIAAFTRPGDKIIVQPPVYFPFFSAIKNNRRIQVDNPLKLRDGRYYFDLDDLVKKIDPKVKMIFLCNPQNPGGSVWTPEELTELAGICIKNNILVVSDEIHSDSNFST
ncbi:Cystathionine beta-lyase PatB [subsurface metagenome]